MCVLRHFVGFEVEDAAAFHGVQRDAALAGDFGED